MEQNRGCYHQWLFSRALRTIKAGILRLRKRCMPILPIVQRVTQRMKSDCNGCKNLMSRPGWNLPPPLEYHLLILDGHHSHNNLRFYEYAWDNKIILLSYPGHSTHLLQPLDVGLFPPLQTAHGDVVEVHMKETRTCLIKRALWGFYYVAQAKTL